MYLTFIPGTDIFILHAVSGELKKIKSCYLISVWDKQYEFYELINPIQLMNDICKFIKKCVNSNEWKELESDLKPDYLRNFLLKGTGYNFVVNKSLGPMRISDNHVTMHNQDFSLLKDLSQCRDHSDLI